MKVCKFFVVFMVVMAMYAVPALAGWTKVFETATDLGPNARPCSFAYLEDSGWVAILRTDTAYAHAMLILKTASDAQSYIGYQVGAGIGACSNLPSLIWLEE